MATPEKIVEGRKAFERRDWGDAYTQLLAADRDSPLEPADVEQLASAAYLIGKEGEAKTFWIRLHNDLVDRNRLESAARVGFWLSLNLLLSGESAQAAGWLARSQRLIQDSPEDCLARGYGCVVNALLSMEGGQFGGGHDDFTRAITIADRFGDADLLTIGLIGEGQARIEAGNFVDGAFRLDEAMAGVTAGDVSPVLAGIAYCAVIMACQQIYDFVRAQEWTRMYDGWCASQTDLVPFRGQCLVHRSEILQAQGDWERALSAVADAREHLADRSEPAVGRACYQQGELHRLRGEFADAEAMYREAARNGCEPQPGMALLRLTQGNRKAAASAIRTAIETAGASLGPGAELARARLLAAYVEILLTCGEHEAARAAAAELAEFATKVGAPVLRALSAQAAGAVSLGEGEMRVALAKSSEALAAWLELDMPYEAARVRVDIAKILRALGDDESADMHIEAARAAFRRLGAMPDLESLKRSGSTGGLTQREREVMLLVCAGKSNRQIAGDLAISEHTVARHLSNIFDKLGVTSRTAACAVARERKLV